MQSPQEILAPLEARHEAKRRNLSDLVRQLERVPELLGRDPHAVQPVEGEHGAGIGHGRFEPVRAAAEPPAERLAASRAFGPRRGDDEARQLLDERPGAGLLDLPNHLRAGVLAIGLDGLPGGRQRVGQVRPPLEQFAQDAEGDVELPDAAKGGRQPAQAPPESADRGLPGGRATETEHRQDLAQAAGGHAGPVQRLDVAVERRGEVTFEGADAARERAPGRQAAHGRHPRPAGYRL